MTPERFAELTITLAERGCLSQRETFELLEALLEAKPELSANA